MTAPATNRRRPLRPRRRGEQGASLVLAMLVIMVLLVVVAQVFYSSMVEVGHTVNFAEGRRFSFIAEASVAEAEAALMLDLERDESGGDETGGDETGGEAGGLFGGAGGGGGGGDDGDLGPSDEEVAADVTADSDSELDEWANVETLVPSVGDGLTILVDVVDEDGKINILGMWTEDEEERDRQREIVEQLLVEAFDGTSYAISSSEATSLVDRLEAWVDGRRVNNRSTIPTPKLKPTVAEDEAAESGEDDSILFDDERHLFLTLAELQMIEGIAPAHLWGFIEEDIYYPGLVEYLTIWSQLELKPEEDDEDEFADSPFADAFGDSEEGADDGEGEEGADGGLGGGQGDAGSSAQPTNNGLVNLNTARYPVLRALAPDEIPNAYLERIVEFRDRIFEYEDELYGEDGFFSDEDEFADEASGFGDAGSQDDGGDDTEDDEDDITRFVFTDVNSVWDKIDEEFGIEPNFDSFIQSEFTRNFTTRSQVFTIKVLILEPMDEGGAGDEMRYRRRSYRTVVWRKQQGDGVEMVTLLPLEPFWDPRRIDDFGVDLDGLGDIRGEFSDMTGGGRRF